MAERTAQCHECADVFECGPTGRLPHLCPKCRASAAKRDGAPAPRRDRHKKAANNGNGSPAILGAIEALRSEITILEGDLAVRREALEALEALA